MHKSSYYCKEDGKYPNINRCQFFAVLFTLAFMENPIIIAESNISGIEGCFMVLLDFIEPCKQRKTYYEEGFNKWPMETYGFEITYKDGFVFMLEKES